MHFQPWPAPYLSRCPSPRSPCTARANNAQMVGDITKSTSQINAGSRIWALTADVHRVKVKAAPNSSPRLRRARRPCPGSAVSGSCLTR